MTGNPCQEVHGVGLSKRPNFSFGFREFSGVKDMKGSQLKRRELAGPNRKTGLELMIVNRQA